MNIIDIDKLNLSFGTGASESKILHDVTLQIQTGESFGLVGESGSGKTTVLRCLAGQYHHWSGQLSVNGKHLQHKLDKKRCIEMQMVFQDPYGSLHPRHSIETALAEPLKIHRMDNRDERISSILKKVGLDDSYRYRSPHQLSGGQRQRVAIARALILEPKILLLDEPTSALDVSVQAEILNLLKDLKEKEGLTYLMVTHDLGVVSYLCDRVAVMQNGHIVETISSEDLASHNASEPYTRMLLDCCFHTEATLNSATLSSP
ncbi:ABC transporter ATP-binding protein [Marinomonas rhizomae]|uniref:ABC transporter ATP-binding protein n=1 Tax=Marinomonas rhizomae TaxID=491948 RepID=UPI002107CE2D|nr:ABC transporter ATP-binding protein [Marinomonas rhizomae]UTV97853.1 ABC transporter ATP-binding protein [Marinomonas rhizomae]